MPPLILFDFDGVIADSFEVFYEEFRAAVGELGFDRLRTREDMLGLFDGNAFLSLVKLGFPVWRLKKLADRFGPRIAAANARVAPFPGMPALVAELAAAHPVHVITSNSTAAVEDFLARHGVSGVRGVVGADKERSKVKKIRRARQAHPDRAAWYIGDTKGDMIEGREAGARTVAVTWGWHDEARLRSGRPDAVVGDLEALRALFAPGAAGG